MELAGGKVVRLFRGRLRREGVGGEWWAGVGGEVAVDGASSSLSTSQGGIIDAGRGEVKLVYARHKARVASRKKRPYWSRGRRPRAVGRERMTGSKRKL